MCMTTYRVLQSLHFFLPDSNFPSQQDSRHFHTPKQKPKSDHFLPFQLLLPTILKPISKYSCQFISLVQSELTLLVKQVISLSITASCCFYIMILPQSQCLMDHWKQSRCGIPNLTKIPLFIKLRNLLLNFNRLLLPQLVTSIVKRLCLVVVLFTVNV